MCKTAIHCTSVWLPTCKGCSGAKLSHHFGDGNDGCETLELNLSVCHKGKILLNVLFLIIGLAYHAFLEHGLFLLCWSRPHIERNVFCRQCCIDLSRMASVGTSVSGGVNGRRMDCEIERSNLELLKTSVYLICYVENHCSGILRMLF